MTQELQTHKEVHLDIERAQRIELKAQLVVKRAEILAQKAEKVAQRVELARLLTSTLKANEPAVEEDLGDEEIDE